MKSIVFNFIFLLGAFAFSQNTKTYIYSIKGPDTLKLDVYSPKNLGKNARLPVVLWMHGGGFAGGKRNNPDEVKFMTYLAEEGYVGISISYRLLLKGTRTGSGCDCPKTFKLDVFRQAAIDYLDAARFIVENSAELQIDTSRIIAGGSSAGAEGVLNAVYLKHFFVDDVSPYEDINFAGVISLAGAVLDTDYISKDNAIPTVLFHGTNDNLVPFEKAPHHHCAPDRLGYMILDGSGAIASVLDELGTSYYLHKVDGGRHELCQIPFSELGEIFSFFNKTINNEQRIQIKHAIYKK